MPNSKISTSNYINQIKKYQLINFKLLDTSICFTFTKDIKSKEDNDDCCLEHLNGKILKYTFTNIKDLKVIGSDCDSYKLLSLNYQNKHIELKYEGYNYISSNINIEISFSFDCLKVDDLGVIKSPEV